MSQRSKNSVNGINLMTAGNNFQTRNRGVRFAGGADRSIMAGPQMVRNVVSLQRRVKTRSLQNVDNETRHQGEVRGKGVGIDNG